MTAAIADAPIPLPLAARPEAALRCRGLGLRRDGRWLLRDGDLDLHPGELLAVTGPSGSGKSTLVRALAGLEPPAAGTVHLPGRRRDAVAVAFQDPGLPGALTGRQAIQAGRLHALSWWRGWWALPDDDRLAVDALAASFGVGHLLERPVATASGGERQRLALARALHHGGRILLLDEPVSQLDPATARLVLDGLRPFLAAGRAAVVVLHQPELVVAYADRELALLGDGAWRCARVPS